jgi:hypothetical protein
MLIPFVGTLTSRPLLSPLLAQQRGRGLFSGNTLWLVVVIGALIIAMAFFAIFARYFRLWIQSVTTGAGIGIFDLLRMTFRKVNPTVITRSKIMAVQAGIYESSPLPGRRKCAARDSLDDRRAEGQDHRPRFQTRDGDRPGRSQYSGSCADQRLSARH